MRFAASIVVWALVVSAYPAAAATCAEAVAGKVECSNPDEVCKLLLGDRDPNEGVELGDGGKGYVFAQRAGRDAYSVVPNYHFAKSGDRLELYFDGHGVPASYLT